jgi:hypothetical protein
MAPTSTSMYVIHWHKSHATQPRLKSTSLTHTVKNTPIITKEETNGRLVFLVLAGTQYDIPAKSGITGYCRFCEPKKVEASWDRISKNCVSWGKRCERILERENPNGWFEVVSPHSHNITTWERVSFGCRERAKNTTTRTTEEVSREKHRYRVVPRWWQIRRVQYFLGPLFLFSL